MILFKMLDKKDIAEIHGCISTGKEVSLCWDGSVFILVFVFQIPRKTKELLICAFKKKGKLGNVTYTFDPIT